MGQRPSGNSSTCKVYQHQLVGEISSACDAYSQLGRNFTASPLRCPVDHTRNGRWVTTVAESTMSGGTKNVHIRRGSQGWRRTNVLYTHNTDLKEITRVSERTKCFSIRNWGGVCRRQSHDRWAGSLTLRWRQGLTTDRIAIFWKLQASGRKGSKFLILCRLIRPHSLA